MARDNRGLPKKMPVKATFVYNIGTGERSQSATRKIKGGDLRARKGLNAGR